jgi:hypothetical protein
VLKFIEAVQDCWREQAISQLCAVYSPSCRSVSEMGIFQQLTNCFVVSEWPTTHPEPVLTQQYPLKVRVRQPNVQLLATVLGDHPRHQVSLSKSQEADHCRKQNAMPEGGTQDCAFLADQTDGRDSDRNVLR